MSTIDQTVGFENDDLTLTLFARRRVLGACDNGEDIEVAVGEDEHKASVKDYPRTEFNCDMIAGLGYKNMEPGVFTKRFKKTPSPTAQPATKPEERP